MTKTWDQSVFQATLEKYLKVTSRTLQTAINTKAYYIARQAIWYTDKADVTRVKTGLGQVVSVNRLTKSGKKIVKRRELVLRIGKQDAPIAALIIQKRMAAKGERSPFYGKSRAAGRALMMRMIKQLLAARLKSIAFIKSGWLPAVKALAPFAERRGQPPIDTSAKQIGQAKGDARPALNNFNPVAQIINLASARRDGRGALVRVGSAGLARAYNGETASMVDYIDSHMKPDSEEFNRQQK